MERWSWMRHPDGNYGPVGRSVQKRQPSVSGVAEVSPRGSRLRSAEQRRRLPRAEPLGLQEEQEEEGWRRGEEKAERAGTASFQIVSPPRPCAEAGGPGSSEAAGRGPATSWRSALLRLPAWKRGRAKFSPSAGACSASLSRVSRAAPLSPPPSGSGFSSSPWPPGRSVLSLPPSRHSGLFSPSLCAPLRFPYLFHFLSLALSSVPISFSQSSLVSLCISASVFPFFGGS
ncbi:uncharacterized protein LOC118908344 [Manis pentadactyla]|uniref:uncharacterized protein LOC118908344 n=1 Tax=Manis pentadactyla TaxID=143292 RepID=UPI00255C4F65|nr:uncharacterized protein LOC118908344 [Manis pentadactyla]XP_057363814.1 uncharacterized protein LOC118908344 [Manis pentadactyla]